MNENMPISRDDVERRQGNLNEGKNILPQLDSLNTILEEKEPIKISHKGFRTEFADWGGSEGGPKLSPEYHYYEIEFPESEKVYIIKVLDNEDPWNAMNAGLKLHTGVDMGKYVYWLYHFDGKSTVEITDPRGKLQKVEVDEERTIEALEKMLKSAMAPNLAKEETFE